MSLSLNTQCTWAAWNENSQYFFVAPAALYFKVFTKENIDLWETTDLFAIQTTEKMEKKTTGI